MSEFKEQNRPIRTIRLTEVPLPYDKWGGTYFRVDVVGGYDGPDDPLYEVRSIRANSYHYEPTCELLNRLNDDNPPPEAALREALREWHGVEVEIVKEDI